MRTQTHGTDGTPRQNPGPASQSPRATYMLPRSGKTPQTGVLRPLRLGWHPSCGGSCHFCGASWNAEPSPSLVRAHAVVDEAALLCTSRRKTLPPRKTSWPRKRRTWRGTSKRRTTRGRASGRRCRRSLCRTHRRSHRPSRHQPEHDLRQGKPSASMSRLKVEGSAGK